ncbi:hypothetical protein [Myxococcus qinghaiensis]|uniref:hypothetical protein n=1 Tax=Myxococcus qinghaiensis TaxID=2906758 RepID=UPI0020A761B3|nr:hypothetical protein [Myxococcus qinghaiensis]MCP3164331.1 hypothetical protein [Myxococcus qinghaiensis]
MGRSYAAIRELNRDRPIAPGDRARVLDVPEECWFYDSEYRLQIWSRETLFEFTRCASFSLPWCPDAQAA